MSFVVNKVSPLLEEKTSQAAILSSVLFFFVANPWLFKQVDGVMKNVGLNLHGQALTAIHSVVFGVLLYLLIIYLFNPVVNVLKKREGEKQE
jgi:uncharacterized membrane protein YjgN (DUF898 family)